MAWLLVFIIRHRFFSYAQVGSLGGQSDFE